MKKFKVNKNVFLNTSIEGDNLVINFTDSKKNSIGNAHLFINTCSICNKIEISDIKQNICDKCENLIRSYTDKAKEVLPIAPVKIRAKKVIVNYNRETIANENIKIENLVEIHNLLENKYSVGKIETLLKLVIMGLTYSQIAQQLKIKTLSVKHDLNNFEKVGIVSNDKSKSKVTKMVNYKIITNDLLDNIPKTIVSMYNSIGCYMKNWISAKDLVKVTNRPAKTVSQYIWYMNKHGLIEKMGNNQNKLYKIKAI